MAEIVGIAASFLGPAIELGKCIAAPIKRQFNYLCCFNSNIRSMKDEAKKLDDARAGLQMQVDAAKNNAEVIFPEVETWLTSANEIQVNISGIEIEVTSVQRGFSSIKSRFSLSRKAKKTIEAMKELRDHCKFNPISQPAPPAAMLPIPCGPTYEFESRKQIEEDIMATLRGKKVNIMGICGMGGVGKTTMAKRIMSRVRGEKLYDELVMVVVSQPLDMLKIQHEIAESLGLTLEKKILSARAHQLRARIMGKNRTLVVLDDVWERLNLEGLGLPCESGLEGCTVLVTSRDRGVLDAMDAQKVCVIQILSEREAWFLFRDKVGTCVDDLNLLSIAKKIAKECKCLPIALITVARALKGKESTHIWEDALKQLKSSNPIDVPHIIAEVYNPLKLSYDFLDNQHARSMFLLCSLFPEDSYIDLDYLTWYVMGFEGIRNLEEARNRVWTLIDMLKSCFLLLEVPKGRLVSMHDVVRDVAIFIASKEGRVDLNFSSMDWWREHSYSDCTWISVFPKERTEFPKGLNFPSLRLLLIHSPRWEEVRINDYFFEGMKELNLLSLKYIRFRSLPQTIQLLTNLQTLHIDGCSLETISVVGELLSLEILCCRHCNKIEELPVELGRLSRLRLLEFSDCARLKRIAPGVISGLIRLEELKMVDSFTRWEAEEKGEERRNASINELQSLSNLTCLQIRIEDLSLSAKEIHLSSEIVKYDMRIHPIWEGYNQTDHEKQMYLEIPEEITIGNWVHIFIRSTEFLYLRGDGSNNVDLARAQNMKVFYFHFCSTVKEVVNIDLSRRFDVFPFLESLYLYSLPNLEEICNGPIPAGSNSFGNLKKLDLQVLPTLAHLWKSPNQNVSLSNLCSICIANCDKLPNLFSLAMAKGGLLQLEELEIISCEMMEEVFWKENKNHGESHIITFPKLKGFSLRNLPSLTTFCKGVESIEFPVLIEMSISKCPKLTSLASATPDHDHDDDDSFHLFCNQKVTFGSLKILTIEGYENISNTWCHQIPSGFFSELELLEITSCDRIRSLFSSSIAGNLVNLKQLIIESCQEMVKVIADAENVGENPPFPSLEWLDLKDLPMLVNFCEWRYALELPSLKHIYIDDCPRMESLTLGSLSTSNLESIETNVARKNVEDLNGAVQPYFITKESTSTEDEEGEEEQEKDEIVEQEN